MTVPKQAIYLSIGFAACVMTLLAHSASVAQTNYRPAHRDNRDYRMLKVGDPKPGFLNLTEVGLVKGKTTSIVVLPDCNSCNLLSVEPKPKLECADSLLFLSDDPANKRAKELAAIHGAELVLLDKVLYRQLNPTFTPRLYRFSADGTLTYIQKQPLSWGEIVAEHKRCQKL